ncbi:MAG: B-type flagellin [Armatimonadota bacterium]|nr:MAG: B-type flagellin [Armatimonadota bacterium]
MSLRINTNTAAMNALRNLTNTSDMFARSIERLSSGLRINRGADDPAGLIISENLRAQMVGLAQATSNAQDAANLVKTAEGALDEIHNLLRTMRQLAVHAANTGVNDLTAVQADQTQIRSALESLNRIAEQTQFGTKKLLDGTAGISAQVTDTARLAGIFMGSTFNGVIVQSGDVTITVNNAATRAQVLGTATYASVNASISTVGGGTSGAGGTVVINGQSITVSGNDTVQTLIDRINALTSVTGVSAMFSSGNGSGVVVLTQVNYGANFSVQANQSATLLFASGTSSSSTGVDAVVTVSVTTSAGVTSATFTGGRASGDSGLKVKDAYGNTLLLTEAGNSTAISNARVAVVSAQSLVFQIGANAGQTARISLRDTRASQLGTTVIANKSLQDIDVTTQQGAQDAIRIIDEAISQISQVRGNIGAFQKQVLESTMRSLNVARENLAASESAIRDTNVAEEVMNYTKLQILQQAGMAVLAQANAAPQAVLSLLR